MSQLQQALTPLTQVRRGKQGRIHSIDSEEVKMVLLKMGINTGDLCRVSGKAPLGDPIAIVVGRTKLSLRKQDAKHIWIIPQN